jgi:dUTP pyrophosphatase
MKVKFKKLHPDATIPQKAHDSDSGYDITAVDDGEMTDTYIQYKSGIAIEVPEGYDIKIFPRSSISKTNLMLANSVGLVDQGYRGEFLCRFKVIWGPNKQLLTYKKGDKIAQLVFQKRESGFEFEEV